MYPGDFFAHCETEIDCSLIEGQFGGGRPQFKLVALAMTLMASVATDRHVHGEASAAGRGVVQGTASVPLIAHSLARLEAEQVEYLLHRDLRATPGMVLPLLVARFAGWERRAVPFPFYIGEQGTALHRSINALPTAGRAAELAGLLQRFQGLAQAFVLNG